MFGAHFSFLSRFAARPTRRRRPSWIIMSHFFVKGKRGYHVVKVRKVFLASKNAEMRLRNDMCGCLARIFIKIRGKADEKKVELD